MRDIQRPDEESQSEDDEPKYISVDEPKYLKKKQHKSRYLAPEYIFIFDDLGASLRDKMIDSLLKVNRHYKAKVILSSQYVNDLSPQSRLQLDYILLFQNLPEQKLQEIYVGSDLSIDYDKFYELYKIATYKKYNFFYIDVRNETFRINFNTSIVQ